MSYLTAQIFSDNRINTAADRLIYFLKEQFPEPLKVDDDFVLSGKSAKVLQDTDGGNASNIVFVCSNQDIYNYLAKEVKNILNAKNIIKFKERLLIDFDFVKIEIWFFNTTINVVEYRIGNVFMQELNQIPNTIL